MVRFVATFVIFSHTPVKRGLACLTPKLSYNRLQPVNLRLTFGGQGSQSPGFVLIER